MLAVIFISLLLTQYGYQKKKKSQWHGTIGIYLAQLVGGAHVGWAWVNSSAALRWVSSSIVD